MEKGPDTQIKDQRNVALLGRASQAKAGLFDRLIITAEGQKLHELSDGGVLDVTPFEPENGPGFCETLAHIAWNDHTISLLNGPNHIEPRSGLDLVLDTVEGVVLVCDGQDEFSLADAALQKRCAQSDVPCLAFLNEIAPDAAAFENYSEHMQSRLAVDVLVLHLPLIRMGRVEGIIDLITLQAYQGYFWQGDVRPDPKPGGMTLQERKDALAARRRLVSLVADLDEGVLAQFLDDEDAVDAGTLRVLIAKAQLARNALPVLIGAGFPGIGVELLLDAMIHNVPAPGSKTKTRIPENLEPKFTARVLGTTDTYFGAFTLVRMLTGALKTGESVTNYNAGKSLAPVAIYRFSGDQRIPVEEAEAGEIIAIEGEFPSRPGDTLSNLSGDPRWQRSDYFDPLIEADVLIAEEDEINRIADLLAPLECRHPSFHVFTCPDKITLRLAGEHQLKHILRHLEKAHGVAAVPDVVRPLYQEVLQGSVEIEETVKKQTGLGLFARIRMSLGPNPEGEHLVFRNMVPSETLSPIFGECVKVGLERTMQNRFRKGFPIHGLTAVLLDGLEHPVDSRPIAFQLAAHLALESGCEAAGTVMLEPIMRVEIAAPEECHVMVLRDLEKRRATILETTQSLGEMVILAHVPRACLFGYDVDLDGLTRAKGDFSMVFDHYAKVPDDVALAKGQVTDR